MARNLRTLLSLMLVALILLPSLGLGAHARQEELVVERIADGSRYKTAAMVSQTVYPYGAEEVILASGQTFSDALAGSVLSGMIDGPILLTRSNKLMDSVLPELERLGAKKVYILGGGGAISQSIENELIIEGYEVKRIAGSGRYATAAQIAAMALDGKTSRRAFLAVGDDYPDALAAGAVAARDQIPILLTKTNSLPASTRSALAELGLDKVYILGGQGAVSAKVEAEVEQLVGKGKVERIFGNGRYSTAKALADYFFSNSSQGVLASGQGFPDALVGSYLASSMQAPVLLIKDNEVPKLVGSYINEKGYKKLTILGGLAVVSQKTEDSLIGSRDFLIKEKNVFEEEDFETITTKDNEKWDNYKEVLREGSKGVSRVTYRWRLESNGKETSPLIWKKLEIRSPEAKKVVIGTKKPRWETKEIIEEVLPEPAITEEYISQALLDEVKSTNDYFELRKSFDSERDSRPKEDVINDDLFISVRAAKGKVGGIYRLAYDPETGLEIPRYEREFVEKKDIKPIQEVKLGFTAKLSESRDKEKSYKYEADETLDFKEEVTVKEATKGKERLLRFDSGLEKWIDDSSNLGKKGLINIGNIEKVTTEYHADAKIVNSDWMFVDETTIVEGAPGVKEETFKYNVNATTGELSGKTSVSSEVIQEARAPRTYYGTITKVGKAYNSDIVANGFMEVLNAERRAAGRGELVHASSAVTKGGIHINDTTSQYSSSLIGSRMAVGFSGLNHVGYGSDNVIALAHLSKFDTGVAREELVLEQVLSLFTSSTHYNILVNNDDTKIVFSMWEVLDTPRGQRVVFVASTGN